MSRHAAGLSEPALATLEALDRLAQSRARLRSALSDPDHAQGSGGPSSGHNSPNDSHPGRYAGWDNRGDNALPRRPAAAQTGSGWWGPLAASPAISLMLELARLWWARQPARVLLMLAEDAAELALRPVARQHPFRLVLGAAAAGAALIALRPWRWVYRSAVTPALLLGLLPQVVSRLRGPPAGGSGLMAVLAALSKRPPSEPHSGHSRHARG